MPLPDFPLVVETVNLAIYLAPICTAILNPFRLPPTQPRLLCYFDNWYTLGVSRKDGARIIVSSGMGAGNKISRGKGLKKYQGASPPPNPANLQQLIQLNCDSFAHFMTKT